MQLTILGSGTSCGVPQIGCACNVCTSNDPHDKRLRCSAIVETEHVRILIDCGPDFRQQMINLNEFKKIDAVLLTHIHYDHVGGIDDLRPFCNFGDIDIYADKKTEDGLLKTIPYCFTEHKYPGVPQIRLKEVTPYKMFHIGDVVVTPIQVFHGRLPIVGYRINDLAYITDMKTIPEMSIPFLQGVNTLVVNALRHNNYKDHPTHQNVEEAIAFSKKIGPERTFFIHMSHHLGLHQEENEKLPMGFAYAYDGLKLLI